MSQTTTPSGAATAKVLCDAMDATIARSSDAVKAACGYVEPSSADVDPLAVHEALWRLFDTVESGTSQDYRALQETGLMRGLRRRAENRTAVAALIARNAELEAERDALTAGRDAYKTMLQQAEEDVSKLAADNLALREVAEATLEACEANIIKNTGDEDAVGVLEDAAREALARTPAKENDDG